MAGGDYYDLFGPRDDRFVVLVGDASGHGMKACMSVVAMHTLVRMLSGDHALQTAKFVQAVNHSICPQEVVTADGGFITMAYCVLDADVNALRWSSAGHPPPLVHNRDTDEVYEAAAPDAGGLPLGLVDDADYEEYRLEIPPNSRVLIYTDGLIDAFPEGEGEHRNFGVDGMARALRSTRHLPIEQALQALFDDSHAFTGGVGRHDDTSVVLLERAE
jgi:serine phosphatase RsbU (regulator of sigma subunit)